MLIAGSFRSIISVLYEDITTIPQQLQEKYIPSLDGLRAFSILFVLVSHFNYRLHNKWLSIVFGSGKLGVYVFFVISGFLITTLLLKNKVNDNIDLKQFYLRRILRIWPVAYFYLFLLFVLAVISNVHIPADTFTGAGLFIMNYAKFHENNWLTGHYWSLSVEEQFYIFFPFILKLNYRLYLSFILAFLVFIVCIRFANSETINLFGDNFFRRNPESIDYFDGIIIGSLLSVMTFKQVINLDFLKKYKFIIHIILIPLTILIFNRILIPASILRLLHPFNPTICSIFIAVLIAANLTPGDDLIFRILNNKLVRMIGILSFSLYIYNMLFTLNDWYIFPAGVTTFPTYHLPVIINLILLFAVSGLSYFLLEKPFLKLKNKIK